MWCTKRRVEPYQEEVKPYNLSPKDLRQSEFLENSPVNEFCFERLDKTEQRLLLLRLIFICCLINNALTV